MRKMVLLVLALVLLLDSRSQAQLEVYDAAADVHNWLQDLQIIATAVNTAKSVANDALNLLPVDEVVVAAGITEDMRALSGILEDVEGLFQDLETLRKLFNPNDIARTPAALNTRMQAMNEAVLKARNYATKAQFLFWTLGHVVEHLTGIVGGISNWVGNKQGQQMAAQLQASTIQILSVTQLQGASYQRAEVLEKMRREVVVRSWNYIQCNLWSDWPGFAGCGGGQ